MVNLSLSLETITDCRKNMTLDQKKNDALLRLS